MTMIFSGSYRTDEVKILLKPVTVENTPVDIKESLIQSGQKHYSEMLTLESLPPPHYVSLFHEALALNQQRMAEHLLILARRIVDTRPNGIALVSLARAGTPVGVLLKRIIERYFDKAASHYSISIIRDIGIDRNAMHHILRHHEPDSLVFVDGWTGKGAIAKQLTDSMNTFAASDGVTIPPDLYVLTDLAGVAAVAASSEDYLIPSSILNATVSGLISRSVYTPQSADPADFHYCVYYNEFEQHDLSRYFIDTMLGSVEHAWQRNRHEPIARDYDREQLQNTSRDLLQWVADRYGVTRYNNVKPGIGEATRVLLRRKAMVLLLKKPAGDATKHLYWLAENRSVPVDIVPNLPYEAVALIEQLT